MADPRVKPFIITLEIEAHSSVEIIKRLTNLIEDERTIAFDVKQKEED